MSSVVHYCERRRHEGEEEGRETHREKTVA